MVVTRLGRFAEPSPRFIGGERALSLEKNRLYQYHDPHLSDSVGCHRYTQAVRIDHAMEYISVRLLLQ
jgi:hypothetical protein